MQTITNPIHSIDFKGEFHIFETKSFGLRLLFTPDDYSLTKSMNWLVMKMNQKTKIFLFPLTKELHFSIKRTSSRIKTNEGVIKPNDLKQIKMRGCVAGYFSSFSLSNRLNGYAMQVKVNEFLKEKEIESLFEKED